MSLKATSISLLSSPSNCRRLCWYDGFEGVRRRASSIDLVSNPSTCESTRRRDVLLFLEIRRAFVEEIADLLLYLG